VLEQKIDPDQQLGWGGSPIQLPQSASLASGTGLRKAKVREIRAMAALHLSAAVPEVKRRKR
jgi:hypothetical protein